MKKTFSLLLVLLGCLTTMQAQEIDSLRTSEHKCLFQSPQRITANDAVVLSGDYAENLYWSLDTISGILTISGNGPMINNPASAAEIPWWGLQDYIHEIHIGNGVTSVGGWAFQYCKNLTSVSLPNTIDSIAQDAFSFCSSLEHISIPQSVKKIGYEAFWKDVSLKDLVLPNSLSEISAALCDSCVSLTHVTIPQGVKLIDRYAFYHCHSLTNVVIPNSVERINYYAFSRCISMDSLTIGEGVQLIENYAFFLTNIDHIEWKAIRCADFYSEGYAPFGYSQVYFTYDGNQIYWNYKDEASIQFVFGDRVERIPAYLMCYDNNQSSLLIPTLTIPASVVEINERAINATNIIWNAMNCKTVAELWNKENVTNIHFGNQVKYIPQNLFDRLQLSCSILQIPQSVDTIGENAFSRSAIESVNYQGSVDQWSHIVFKNESANPACNRSLFCNYNEVTDVVLTGLYDYVGDYAFMRIEGLTSLSLAEGIRKIGNSAFYGCEQLLPVSLPTSIEHIGNRAFHNVEMEENLRLPNIKSIGERAFNSNNIKSIRIGNYIEKIGYAAFVETSSLEEFIIDGQPEFAVDEYDENFYIAHLYAKNLRSLKCPAEFLAYSDNGEMLTTSLLERAITNQLDSIVITSGELSYSAFQIIKYNANTIKTVDLSSAENTSLSVQTFKDCQWLTTLRLPVNLTSIPSEMANGCLYLKNIAIPASVTTIEDRAFENCRSLTNIQFEGNSLTHIGNWAFYNGHALSNLTIPEAVTEIGDGAFYGCSYMDELSLPSTLYSIGDNCFGLCSNLKKISVNANIPPMLYSRTFHMVNRQIPVFVPLTAVADYQANTYWSEFNIMADGEQESALSNNLSKSESTRKVLIDSKLYISTLHGIFCTNGQKVK